MQGTGRLAGKSAIVVGGGQTPGETIGNGRATAITFAREGARVLVVDLNEASAIETCEMIEKNGDIAVPFAADITKAEDCSAFAKACLSTFGSIDILHNSAAINVGDNHVELLEEQAWDQIQQVNVKGIFLACRAIIPHMQNQGSGAIVNVSSTAAIWSGDPYVAYNTSKAAVNGLTTTMTVDCAKYGIRVNAIMPGTMNTPMGIDAVAREKAVDAEALRTERDNAIPLNGKQGTGWDIANAALFLASDEARFITGAILTVDGGQILKSG